MENIRYARDERMNDMRIDTPKDLVGALMSGLVCWLRAGSDDRDLGNFLGRVTGVAHEDESGKSYNCLLYTSPSPRDKRQSRMPSSA